MVFLQHSCAQCQGHFQKNIPQTRGGYMNCWMAIDHPHFSVSSNICTSCSQVCICTSSSLDYQDLKLHMSPVTNNPDALIQTISFVKYHCNCTQYEPVLIYGFIKKVGSKVLHLQVSIKNFYHVFFSSLPNLM